MRCRTSRWLGAFAVVFGILMVIPGFGQYREYYVYGKVVDIQKAPLEGVEVTITETRYQPQLHPEDEEGRRVQVSPGCRTGPMPSSLKKKASP